VAQAVHLVPKESAAKEVVVLAGGEHQLAVDAALDPTPPIAGALASPSAPLKTSLSQVSLEGREAGKAASSSAWEEGRVAPTGTSGRLSKEGSDGVHLDGWVTVGD